MKKICFIICTCLSLSFARGQNSHRETLDSIVTDREMKSVFYYTDGALNQQLLFDWDHNSESWHVVRKIDYQYHTSGKIAGELYAGWDNPNSTWANTGKLEMHYDQNNHLTEIVRSKWDSGNSNYILEKKQNITYDPLSRELARITLAWNINHNAWDSVDKKVFNYEDPNTSPHSTLLSEWEVSQALWIEKLKDTFLFNDQGQIDQRIRMISNSRNQAWRNFEKITYEYDMTGNIISEITSEWEWEGGGSWREEEKAEYIFDLTVDSSSLTIPFDYEWPFKLNLIEKYFKMPFHDNWNNPTSVNYYYSSAVVNDIEDFNNLNIKIFPNPAIDHIFIGWNENQQGIIEVFNSGGNKIAEQQLIPDNVHKLSLSGYASGIYIYKIHTEKGKATGKIIKK